MKLPIPGPGYTTGTVSKAKPANKATVTAQNASFNQIAHPAGKAGPTYITRKGPNPR